jgi:hypothetical protein
LHGVSLLSGAQISKISRSTECEFQLFQQQLTDLNTDEISLALVLFLILFFAKHGDTPKEEFITKSNYEKIHKLRLGTIIRFAGGFF